MSDRHPFVLAIPAFLFVVSFRCISLFVHMYVASQVRTCVFHRCACMWPHRAKNATPLYQHICLARGHNVSKPLPCTSPTHIPLPSVPRTPLPSPTIALYPTHTPLVSPHHHPVPKPLHNHDKSFMGGVLASSLPCAQERPPLQSCPRR